MRLRERTDIAHRGERRRQEGRIATPVMVATAILASIAVLVGLVAAISLRWAVKSKDEVIVDHAEDLFVLEDYIVANERASRKARAYLLTANERFAVERRQARGEMNGLYARLNEQVTNPAGRTLLERAATLDAALAVEMDKLLDARRKGMSAEDAGHHLERELQPMRDELDETLATLKRHTVRLLDEAKSASTRNASAAFTVLVGAIGMAMLSSGALAYLLLRAYSRIAGDADYQSRVIGIVGHDVRSPLTSILATAAHAAANSEQDDGVRRAWTRVLRSARRIESLTRLLVDFTRTKMAYALPIVATRANAHELAEQVIGDIKLTSPNAHVVFTRTGDGYGDFDPDRIQQALANLIDNALRHGAADSPVLVETRGANPSILEFRVENRGKPIPSELLPQVFEPFKYAKREQDAPVRESLGMGLYIVSEVARAHGGRVDVESTEERTVFTLRIPRIPAEA